jgi:RNA polymerase primary sigma factor
MESKTTATAQKEEAQEKEAPEASDVPLPLLDLSDAAVKKLIRSAKKHGYVTHDQINSVSPSEEVNSEHIEEETEPDEDNQRKEPEENGGERRGRDHRGAASRTCQT